jgi:predicted dehydrogenase
MSGLADIGAAVVGTGFIGIVHVDALTRLGVPVLGVVGSSQARAEEKRQAAPLPPAYPSFEAMLADDRVDVVHLTTPNHLHHAQAVAALAAGKHVVCEKPLAMTSAQTAELVALAARTGLVCATNFNVRFYPQCLQAREMVRAGELGDVRLVSGGYLQDWLMYDTDWNWRLDPALGGALRAVGDIGSHWIDLVGFVTGREVEAVMADLTTFMPVRRRPAGPVETFVDAGEVERVTEEVATEDAAGILLRLAGGARAVLTVSQVSAGRKNRVHFEVDGSRAALAWDGERPEELWVGRRDAPSQVLLRDPGAMHPGAAGHTRLPAGHAEGFADTFRELYRAVYAAVAAGGPPSEPGYPTFADGHREVLVGEAIARSAAEGRWITVAQEDTP